MDNGSGFKKLGKELLSELDRLSSLSGLLDIDLIWLAINRNSGIVGSMCVIGALLTFGMTCAAVLRVFYRSGEFHAREHYSLFFRAGLVLIFFCISYPLLAQWVTGLSSTLNEYVAGDSLRAFRSQLRSLFFSFQGPPESGGFIRGAIRFIGNILSLLTMMTVPIVPLMLMIAMQLLLAFVFIIMSVGPFFLIIALLMGPICMPLSLMFPNIGYCWVRLLLSGMFFPLFVSVGIVAISNAGALTMASEFVGANQQLMALLMILFALTFLTLIPFVISQIFQVTAYSFLGSFMGWIFSLTVVLSPVAILSTFLHYTVSRDIKRGNKSGGGNGSSKSNGGSKTANKKEQK